MHTDVQLTCSQCHLRLTTPRQVKILVEYFAENPVVQLQGLDASGASLDSADATSKPITMEVVQGKREEVYWERVPEKVRRQAVQKAIAQMTASDHPKAQLHSKGEEGPPKNKRKQDK